MDQILIYHPNGSFEAINSNSKLSAIKQAEHRKAMLGDDVITMTIQSATVRNFGIGDYIQVLGLPKYKINQKPKDAKKGERFYEYELTFEGLQYDLLRASFRNTDVSSVNNSSDFALVGDIEMFLNVIINNLNRVFGSGKWALGSFPTGTETKNLLFNNEKCLSVLERLCDEYKYQYVFEETSTQNILHVRTLGTALDFNFKYGQAKGLVSLARQSVDGKNIVNTLWAYGSSKNLPANYKNYSPRLRLGALTDFPIEEAVSKGLFGTFEDSITFDDIYPHRVGAVTAIDSANRLDFVDADMDFDLNAKSGGNSLYLIPGNSAKIRFQTGNLAGYEFELIKYLHSSRTFTLKANKDAKGFEIPSKTESAFQISIGDKYVIVDIIMPGTYISAAEDELAQKAVEYLSNNAFPMLKYSLEVDETYLKSKATSINVFEIGDTVNIQDDALGINTRIKITEFTRDILRPYKYSLTIQDTPQTSLIKKIIYNNKKYDDIIKHRSFDDPIKGVVKDYQSTEATLDELLNKIKKVVFGRESEEVEVGNSESKTTFFGEVGFRSGTGANAKVSTDLLQSNVEYTYKFPDAHPGGITILNDWNYLVGVPTFFFQQHSAASIWTITHNKGQKCMCQTFNTSGKQVFGTIEHISDDELRVTFNSYESGYALLMGIKNI